MDTYTITIDGGTTNTRCILWNSSRQRIDEQKREVGVRNTAIDGNNSKLKNAVKECLEQLLEDHSLTYDNINHIIASGMITSDVGIVVVPHLTAPADLEQIARSTVAIGFQKYVQSQSTLYLESKTHVVIFLLKITKQWISCVAKK